MTDRDFGETEMAKWIFTRTVFAAASVTLVATGLSVAAHAQPREVRTAIVEYGDLNLRSDEGKTTLQGRIRGAIRTVCGTYDTRAVREMMDHRRCWEEASMSAQQATVTILAAAAAGELQETAMVIRR